MTGKISGLLLLVVAVAMLLIGNQLIALVAAVAGVLFLLYSFGDLDRLNRRDEGGFWVDGGTTVSDGNSCDPGSSAGDSGCGDGGGGGGD